MTTKTEQQQLHPKVILKALAVLCGQPTFKSATNAPLRQRNFETSRHRHAVHVHVCVCMLDMQAYLGKWQTAKNTTGKTTERAMPDTWYPLVRLLRVWAHNVFQKVGIFDPHGFQQATPKLMHNKAKFPHEARFCQHIGMMRANNRPWQRQSFRSTVCGKWSNTFTWLTGQLHCWSIGAPARNVCRFPNYGPDTAKVNLVQNEPIISVRQCTLLIVTPLRLSVQGIVIVVDPTRQRVNAQLMLVVSDKVSEKWHSCVQFWRQCLHVCAANAPCCSTIYKNCSFQSHHCAWHLTIRCFLSPPWAR